jgi:hypothetical protein
MEKKRNVYKLSVGKPHGKPPLTRPRCNWVINIKMNIVEIGWDSVDWIGLALDRYKWRALENALMNIRVP